MSTLRMRIFLVFGLLFVAVLATDQLIERFGLPLVSFEGRNKEKQQEAFRALNLIADLKKDRLLFWLEERRSDARIIAQSPLILSALGRVEKKFHQGDGIGITGPGSWEGIQSEVGYRDIRQHLDVVMSSYRAYERIDFIDLHSGVVMISTDKKEQGSVIFDSGVSPSSLSSSGDSSIFTWRHPQSGLFDMHIVCPVSLPGENGKGLVLLMHVNTSHFLEPLLHTGGGLGETGEALLVNGEARILAPLKFPLQDGAIAKPLEYRITAEPARLAAEKEEGIIAARDYRGVPVLAAYRYIELSPEKGWGLVVKRDRAEIFSGYRREDLLSLVLIACGMLFVIGCTYVLAGNLAGPIMQVSKTAKRVQEGDLGARVQVQGTPEVKVLAEAFNSMVQQLKTYMDQLQEQNEELEAFIYTAAHDLKNPLIGAQGFLHLFNKSISGAMDDKQKHLLDRATTTLQQLERILTDLLKYSQVRAAPLEAGSVGIEGVIERIKTEQWEKIRGSGARIHLREDLPEIKISESRAYQVFSNLISNSLKFTRSGVDPVIEIGMIADPQEMVPEKHTLFYVTDNGIGIDPKWHDQIFGLFEQVDHTRDEGSGTGLAIVKRIMRQVNGRIWVRSTPGSGATFYFTLPTSL